jgi:hypothetical protein
MKPCTAHGCTNPMKDHEAFCKDHWFKLPKPLRDGIMTAYRSRNRNASLENITEAYGYLKELEA